jgi:glycosyltransferase involved in cell wall biosynthesis
MNYLDPQPSPPCDITFFIACYNEEGGIVNTLDTLLSALRELTISYDIVVVDDASKDRTVELVRNFISTHPDEPIKLLVNEMNAGLGNNFAEAAFHGAGEYYRLVCGDNVESKEVLVDVLRHLGEADIVLCYHTFHNYRPWHRQMVSAAYTATVNLIGGYKLKYYNGLPICRRYDVMRWHSNAHGFGFQADLIVRLLDLGANYVEVPITPRERATGTSHAFTLTNLCSVAHTLLDLAIRRSARIMYPQRFTRPLARRREHIANEEAAKPSPLI